MIKVVIVDDHAILRRGLNQIIAESDDMEVTYELTPRGKDVLLVIIHRRVQDRELQANVMGGWDVHTGILEDVLKGVEPRPFWKTHSKLAAEYAATL